MPPEIEQTAALDRSVARQALDTQTSLLPHALAAFAVSLPFYVWAGS